MSIKARKTLGTPYANGAKLLFLGAGELGKETMIEAQRMGIEIVAVDRYANSPGMQVAHKSYVTNMKSERALLAIVEREKPDAIIPEIEAINTDTLFKLEKEGFFVAPCAKAVWTAMHRERLREAIASAGVKTSKYEYATDLKSFKAACEKIGYPCVSKPIMSSSGKGSYFLKSSKDVDIAFKEAAKARGASDKIIVEEFIDFDIEITALSVHYRDDDGKEKSKFVKPLGHYQISGDYHSSWHPWIEETEENAKMIKKIEKDIYDCAERIMNKLGGFGLFAHEMFIDLKNGKVYANETACRPHDTGLVTLASMPLGYSEFALHAKAVLGLPIKWDSRVIDPRAKAASHVILSHTEGWYPQYKVAGAYDADTNILLFGKPETYDERRLGVVLSCAGTVDEACRKAQNSAHKVQVSANDKWADQEITEKHY
ncbi:formate-dependent phosphoribosylglycinamide formyltransferase [Methanocella sp. CWC-04]|uniref:Formate-dependent phosphoribosylglycinamide formyltransferase n=1 Tax=Methanooceanicella nereidis TaxID=2052831 RepID=A0AAP2RCK9_9EURY|nr:formate-dependent phosphoribosylglycinamide formyltransferase [Methanocella sp. CWC-04]MCD1294933.1 formate-dependent phosphoribosylglycinamide formyltransferase [Methanocella sp. CWC-04]